MNTYKSDRPCAKCGHVGTEDEFAENVINRFCTNCGYCWAERPLDLKRVCPHQAGVRCEHEGDIPCRHWCFERQICFVGMALGKTAEEVISSGFVSVDGGKKYASSRTASEEAGLQAVMRGEIRCPSCDQIMRFLPHNMVGCVNHCHCPLAGKVYEMPRVQLKEAGE